MSESFCFPFDPIILQSVTLHMIPFLFVQAYLAMAKGGLVEDHVLILPVEHHQSTAEAPENVLDEIEKYNSMSSL